MALEVDIRKRLRGFDLNVQFCMDPAEGMMALLGPSGCGKSMTLKCIAGVVRPDEGRIVLNGRVLFDAERRIDLSPQQRHVGYLFQNYALFPNMTVWQNVMAGASGATRAEREEQARVQIHAMHLDGLEKRRPSELSGGQQQRCAMARILASKPELILLDEPFSALDGYLRWQIEMELTDTLRSFPGGAVFVSHNRDEVYRLCSTVCVLSEGQSDPKVSVKELFARPGTLAAALISGCKNVSKAHAVETSATPVGGSSGSAGNIGATKAWPDTRVVDSGLTLLRCEDWGVTLATSMPVPEGVTHVGIRAHYFTVEAGPTTENEPGLASDGKPGSELTETPGFAPSGKPGFPDARRVGVECKSEQNAPAHGVLNRIPCRVDRVIDNTFSTIVMAQTPGGALLRYECEKETWNGLGNPSRITLTIDPKFVMPLVEGSAQRA